MGAVNQTHGTCSSVQHNLRGRRRNGKENCGIRVRESASASPRAACGMRYAPCANPSFTSLSAPSTPASRPNLLCKNAHFFSFLSVLNPTREGQTEWRSVCFYLVFVFLACDAFNLLTLPHRVVLHPSRITFQRVKIFSKSPGLWIKLALSAFLSPPRPPPTPRYKSLTYVIKVICLLVWTTCYLLIE